MVRFFNITGIVHVHWTLRSQTAYHNHYKKFRNTLHERLKRTRPDLFTKTSTGWHGCVCQGGFDQVRKLLV